MQIVTKSIRVIDYEAQQIYTRETPASFDEYVTELITKGMCRYACLWGIFILVSFLAIEIVSSEPFAWPLLQKLFSMIKNILTIPASNSLST